MITRGGDYEEKYEMEVIFYIVWKVLKIYDYLIIDTYKSNEIKINMIQWGWMIAKWVWDETPKLGQHRRYQSWDSHGE